jgi:hypothetical protein
MKDVLFIALVLACPLMMILMMRGHGPGGHAGQIGGRHGHGDISSEPKSAAELRRQRDELDRLIEEREAEEETPTPIGGVRR